MNKILCILIAVLALGGCSMKDIFGWPSDHWQGQDFKPYIEKQAETLPATVKKDEAWLYQPGVEPAAVADQLATSQIIKRVVREKSWFNKNEKRLVLVGVNFYQLSAAGQRQVLVLLDNMYRFSETPQLPVFLKDAGTKQIIGQFADGHLMLY